MLSEEAADLAPLPLPVRDLHLVVGAHLVAHPGDDGGFGPPLQRDALGTGDGTAADRSRVFGDGRCQPSGQVGTAGIEGQEVEDGATKRIDVLRLCLFPALPLGLALLGVARRGALGSPFAANRLDDALWRPHAAGEKAARLVAEDDGPWRPHVAGEEFAPVPDLHGPVRPGRLDSSCPRR